MCTLEELKTLTDTLDKASRMYYNGEDSGMSDIQFDLQMHGLYMMEKELNFVYPNSPTLRVGSDIQEGFKKISHPSPMLTIDNVYTEDELVEWLKKMQSTYGVDLFNCSVKYDGVSCELRYVNGVFTSASTRGDKNVGDDITENVKTIRNIPLVIPQFENIPDVYVRGEILMRKSTLVKLNEERKERGENLFVNTRNACAGSVKQLDPKVTASRNLIFKAWDILSDSEIPDMEGDNCLDSMLEKYYLLRHVGFYYEECTFPFMIKGADLIESVQKFYNNLKEANLDYDFDGVVIKLDDCVLQKKIGTKDTRAIEWGIARKWNEEVVRTVLNNIEWQVGRTGVVTPVAILEPVECSGVTVSTATLHNVEVVREKDIHLGNYVDIVRSGEVIPYVVNVYHDLLMEANGAYPKAEIPTVCPVCGGGLIQEGKILKCVNDTCPAVVKEKILHFCSKEGCNIMSVGESVVNDLYEKRIIRNILDIIQFERFDFVEYASKRLGRGYGNKKITKIFEEFKRAKSETPFEKLLCAISIPGVGKVNGRILAEHFKNTSGLINATVEELNGIDGIGEIMSADIYNWINSAWGRTVLEGLSVEGWQCECNGGKKEQRGDLALSGKTVCFTGKSYRFSGDDVEKFLDENGAKCTHSVSKSMDYLIVGEKPGGSKVDKAKGFGVEIIAEKEFYEKFKI